MQKRYVMMLFVLILLGLGLGYASLQTNLNITGTTTLKDNRWDIHLENVSVNNESVSATTPTINTNRDTVTYSVTLNKPGDFYEFTVDAKNDGSIDGMISNVSSKLNGAEITTPPTALSYSLTYSDGVAIANNHLLSAGDKVTYKLKVAYRTDISASDLPDTETSLNFSFTVTYVQADNNAITKPNPPTFTVSSTRNFIGSPLPSVTTYNNYNDAVTAFGHPFFLKHVLDSNNNIASTYVGFVLNDNVYYLQGAGATYDSTNNIWNNDSIYYATNKATLLNAFGSENCTETTTSDYTYTECTLSDLTAGAYDNGVVEADDDASICGVSDAGDSNCVVSGNGNA